VKPAQAGLLAIEKPILQQLITLIFAKIMYFETFDMPLLPN
jgi:hypothetical protein